MLSRVVRWLQWGMTLSLLPVLCGYLLRFYQAQESPSLGDLLGTGQGLLVAVGWLGVGLKELKETPVRRSWQRDLATWLSQIFVVTSSIAYGFVTAQVLQKSGQSAAQANQIAWLSTGTLVVAAGVCCFAIAIGTSDPVREP